MIGRIVVHYNRLPTMNIRAKLDRIESMMSIDNPFRAGTHTFTEYITLGIGVDLRHRRDVTITDATTGESFPANDVWMAYVDDVKDDPSFDDGPCELLFSLIDGPNTVSVGNE